MPAFPEGENDSYQINLAEEWSTEQIEFYNRIANDVYR
jgi:hypothetical protein